ncbi:MAG TPA: polynucleotide adenylyltransferase PcnB [Thermoanaerobaculia bacterium]|nr:polynucleotide adenylyltransferase PcnB [Thermoanaerobaculia bacterium]
MLPRPEHCISRKNISSSALKVLYRLDRAGYDAFLVGGGVRDLLLGRRPKDFDIATDARPERARRLFRNSRIIGRRFRLVHVIFPDGMIEVSTFRGDPDPERQKRRPGELLVTSDNTWGTPREDAFRRDFTVNALFYRISDYAVIDYVGGLRDLERRTMRVIGDPDVRFREDPVRMMRACELAGRLGFDIEARTQRGIRANAGEIVKASPARLTEELLELMTSGHSEPSLVWALELGLLDEMLPEAVDLLTDQASGAGFAELLPTLDRWIGEGRQPGDAVLFALFLAPGLTNRRAALERKKSLSRRTLQRMAEEAVAELGGRFRLSRARTQHLYWLLETFQRICEPQPSGDALYRLVARPAFAEALELFELLSDATDSGREALEEWREAAHEVAHAPRPAKRRRRRRRRRR